MSKNKKKKKKEKWWEYKWNIRWPLTVEIIWSSFSFLNFSKRLIKPIYVIKSLFYLFLYWFITLSYKSQEGTSCESSHSSMFFQSCRWKWKETSTRYFFKLSKEISTMDVFIILQVSTNDFRVRIKGGRQQYYKKPKQIRCFNVINIAECWWEIFCTSKESIVNQSCSTQFPMVHFPRWLYLFHGQLVMSLRYVKSLVICKC